MFIAQNFHKPIKAADIGKAVGLHPDYANNLFRKAFGCTLHQFLLQERISNAERLLVTTDKPITEIGLSCGFSTIARFNATFMKRTECTPSEYRKRYDYNAL
ncbi:helix-turn-helix transcriptional regulator [Xylanibacter muris]|nr:helix-turn-helix transcriptional regulator [Xylanibacter muris]